ncbi:hypothetical protein [Carboxylicivirga linearis]|uniref:Uncharacterized protein n=1 Tax=Carboxylicivirga linearis TaxID=1628157 RepID=A0ABS5JW19_9BACT|nr:hypothetical protein [Carboxylicivirga linearis]MBS2099087.1 hypothetical protein [Carboxylicivirga linearis]
MKVLKFPYPYKAWFTLCNDPDHTTPERWKIIHRLVWQELGLPFGDALFVSSHNQYLNDQVNLADHGQAILQHPYDILHSWGDFRHAGKRAFDREDAIKAIELLKAYGLEPRVWTDHSNFTGNFMHNSEMGAVRYTVDASGYRYENQRYSMDYAYDLGIRYIWDGKLSSVIGQGGSHHNWVLRQKMIRFVSKIISKLFAEYSYSIDPHEDLNDLTYKPLTFPDGHTFYVFRRYGLWKYADIDGLPKLVNKATLNQLIKKQGTCILYTHLGKMQKRLANGEQYIIPDATINALNLLRDSYEKQEIMLSPVSTLLDYCVIRDHIQIDNQNKVIRFTPDGIRFAKLNGEDLQNKKFSFIGNQSINDFSIETGTDCNYEIIQNQSVQTIKFI